MGRTSNADQKLMDAALELIWEESYGSVTIEQICTRADVKTGSFYYFFKSKADLAVASLERLWNNEWKPNLDKSFSPSLEPLTRLTTYLGTIHGYVVETKAKYGRVLGCPVCSVGSEVGGREVDLGEVIRGIISRKRRYFESAVRDAVAEGAIEPCDPAEAALAVFALIEGLVSQARIMNDPDIVKQLPAMALGLLRVRVKAPAVEPVHS